jgi:multidrug efflux system membrane fusion protein
VQSIDPIYVDFDMNEQAYLATRARQQANGSKDTGMPVAIALANGGNNYSISGTLKAVDNQLDPATGSLRARAVVANRDGSLLPGLFARVRVGTPTPVNAVVINDAAIGTDQDKRNVFVVGSDNKAHYREVQTGPLVEVDGKQMRVITGGLNGGEHIVVNGLMRVHPEGAVVPQMVDMNTLSPTTPMGGAAPVSGTEK